mmetsp:Transcript_86818/g.274031  ORF Transcript_86818/g.274031 Transcript_86818/m.274031 type:complete len:796 (-) Transcript_86818:67-2454(-)
MTLFDWWGFVGTGIQSAFAWMTFNRDAFADNVAMRQNQKYQQKNYQISWVAIARDDIRDMMGISVNRINNYMIVATLILSVAAGTVISVSFEDSCPGFLVNAFYLCMGTSLTFLLLAIMFGVSGQNSAFTNTMKLLTYQVRPENPAEYSHEYMQQVQWIEQNGPRSLFRLPGLKPSYHTDPQAKGGSVEVAVCAALPQDVAADDINLEDATPLESLVVRSSHTWYLSKFAQFMRLWHPYDTSSKYAMGLGIISLGQGTAYFSLGTLLSHRHLDEFSALVVASVFIFMVLLSTMQHLHSKTWPFRYGVFALLSSGPLFGCVGAVTDAGVRQVVVPLCFLCHAAFWFFALLLLTDPTTLKNDLNLSEGGFWAEGQDASTLVAQASGCDLGRRGNRTVRQDALQSAFRGQQPDDPEVAGGPVVRQRHADYDGALVDGCCGLPFSGGGGRGNESSINANKRTDARAYLERDRSPKVGTADSHCPDHWPTDDAEFEEKAMGTKLHTSNLVKLTLVVTLLLWLLLCGWAIVEFWIDPVSMQVRPSMGFNLTAVEAVEVQWPGPLFHPESLACTRGSIYVADRFRVFELSTRGPARPVACGLRRPIVSIAAGCDKAQGCRPLVLTSSGAAGEHGAPSEVVDCGRQGGSNASSSSSWPLLQDDVPAELLAVSSYRSDTSNIREERLVVARGGELLQHMWLQEAQGWTPEWVLGSLGIAHLAGSAGKDSLIGLGAAQHRLFAFRETRPHVDARSLTDLKVLAQLRLPAEALPLAGGCAWSDSSALVLRRSALGDPPRLFRVELP